MLDYEGLIIRPPSEAESLILQVTVGCTDNNCIFCPAYKEKQFKIKNISQIESEIKSTAELYPETRRIFLADGDAIVIPQAQLLTICELLNTHFPKLTRISVYGSIKSLKTKSVAELSGLKLRKLSLIYMGMETGDDEVYKLINKFGSPQGNIDTCLKIKEPGIKVNSTVILGLGGIKYSNQHAVNTAAMLNKSQPGQIAALTLMIVQGTPIFRMQQNNEFVLPDKFGLLKELLLLLENLDDFRCLFFSNHASNYLPINARFPKDKPEIINSIKDIINTKNEKALKPEFLRDL